MVTAEAGGWPARALALLIAVLLGSALVAVTAVGDGDARATVLQADGGGATDTGTWRDALRPPATVAAPATSAPPATVAAPAPAGPVAAAPTTIAAPIARTARTPAPKAPAAPAPAPAPGAGTGTIVALAGPGIYVFDVASGQLTRLADLAPYDVAGSDLLLAAGTEVAAIPLTGGPRQLRYRIAGNEAISGLESAPDGTAVLRTGPTSPTARHYNRLVSATGEDLVTDIRAFDGAEWSADGSTLVLASSGELRGLDASGQARWGPVAMPESTIWSGPVVSSDGGMVAGEFNGHQVSLLDVASGQWRATGVWRSVAFGPGPRLMGQPSPPPGWGGRDPLGMVLWNPADGSSVRFAGSGAEPSWAPDGRHATTLEAPVSGPDNGERHTFRLRDAGGVVRYTFTTPDGVQLGRGTATNGVPSPQWSSDGRFLVLGAG